MTSLSPEQVSRFKRDGFLSPFPLLDDAAREDCLQGLARLESWLGAAVNATRELKWRTMPYITMPWALRLATDPLAGCRNSGVPTGLQPQAQAGSDPARPELDSFSTLLDSPRARS